MSCRNKTYFKYKIPDLFPSNDTKNQCILDLKIKVAEKHYIDDPLTMKIVVNQQILHDDLLIDDHIAINDDINIVFLSTTKYHKPISEPKPQSTQYSVEKPFEKDQTTISSPPTNEKPKPVQKPTNNKPNPNIPSDIFNKSDIASIFQSKGLNQSNLFNSSLESFIQMAGQNHRNPRNTFTSPGNSSGSFMDMAMSLLKPQAFGNPPDFQTSEADENSPETEEEGNPLFSLGDADESFNFTGFGLPDIFPEDEKKYSKPCLTGLITSFDETMEDEPVLPEPEKQERPKASPVSSMSLEEYEEAYSTISEMGFEEKVAIHALNKTNGDTDAAIEYLLSNVNEEGCTIAVDETKDFDTKDILNNLQFDEDGTDFGLPKPKLKKKANTSPSLFHYPHPESLEQKQQNTSKACGPISSDSTELESPERLLLSDYSVTKPDQNSEPNPNPQFDLKSSNINIDSVMDNPEVNMDGFNMNKFISQEFSKGFGKLNTPNGKPQSQELKPQPSAPKESDDNSNIPSYLREILAGYSQDEGNEILTLVEQFKESIGTAEIIELYEACNRNLENTYAILSGS